MIHQLQSIVNRIVDKHNNVMGNRHQIDCQQNSIMNLSYFYDIRHFFKKVAQIISHLLPILFLITIAAYCTKSLARLLHQTNHISELKPPNQYIVREISTNLNR